MKLIIQFLVYSFLVFHTNVVLSLTFREKVLKYASLTQQCKKAVAWDKEYRGFISLRDLANAQPPGKYIELKLHILGNKDAHIVLSQSQTPDLKKDNVYEIVIGGWDNTRTAIRKKINRSPFSNEKTKEILSEDQALSVELVMTREGEFTLILNSGTRVIEIKASDEDPVPIKYIGFGAAEHSQVEFFYDCKNEERTLRNADFTELNSKCKTVETSDETFREFFPIPETDGLLKFTVFIVGESSGYMLLSASKSDDKVTNNAYELEIGMKDTNKSGLKRRPTSILADITYPKLFTKDGSNLLILHFNINIYGGSFAVYKKNNISDEFELLLSGRDPNPIPIKYIGFASKNNQRLRYYYDCPFFPSNDEIKFKGLELPSNLLQTIYTESEFLAKCKRVVTGDNDYKNFIPVPDTSRPPGYVFRFPFYIRGAFDSHILLTEKPVADPSVHNYEFIIGFSHNKWTILRYKINAVQESKRLNDGLLYKDRARKFFVEFKEDGFIQLLTLENGNYAPLLTAFDPNSVNIKHISFGGYGGKQVEFFYNCPGDDCNQYHTSRYAYDKFYKISDMKDAKPTGYQLKMIFYVRGGRDAHILLSSNENNQDAYEVVIGGWRNTRSVIRKGKVELGLIQESDLLAANRATRFNLEVKTDGEIRLSVEQNKQFRTLVYARDPTPTPVNYISFASYNNENLSFLFQCATN